MTGSPHSVRQLGRDAILGPLKIVSEVTRTPRAVGRVHYASAWTDCGEARSASAFIFERSPGLARRDRRRRRREKVAHTESWRARVDTFTPPGEVRSPWEINMRRLASALCAVAALTAAGGAHAANVSFQAYGEVGTDGYVDGTLFGLADSGTSTPTGVSFIAGSYFGDWADVSGYYSLDATSAGTLTITNGQVEFDGFGFEAPSGGDRLEVADVLDFNANFNDHSFSRQAADGSAQGGFVYFEVSPAPEPSTWSLLVTAVGLAGLALRRRGRPGWIARPSHKLATG